MQLSFEILDHIFSFLVSHRETLLACSIDPVLSQIVERHLYYHIIIDVGNERPSSKYAFEPGRLSELVSKNPRILYYIRILQIQIRFEYCVEDSVADLLLKLPVLECIIVNCDGHYDGDDWYWSDEFRAALEDRLSLPTVKELHIEGCDLIPFSLIAKSKNIKKVTLSGVCEVEGQIYASTLPQLQSLRLLTPLICPLVMDWVKRHVNELRSLVYVLPDWEDLSGLLEACSGTLTRWDVNLGYSRCMVYPSSYWPHCYIETRLH
jgi:hypothetical protein